MRQNVVVHFRACQETICYSKELEILEIQKYDKWSNMIKFCFLTQLQLLATTAFLKIKLQYVAFLVHSEIKVCLMQVLLNYFPDSLLFLFLFPPSISTFGNDGFLKMELQLFAWLVHTEIKINEVRFIILNINNF